MKKILLAVIFTALSIAAFGQENYNINVGGLPFTSGSSVPGSCPRDGAFFWKNSTTKGWYQCVAGAYIAIASSGGTVTSVSGTANQITSTGTIAITLSLPSVLTLPGTLNRYTFTAPATAATFAISDNKSVSITNSLTFSGTDSTVMTFPSTSATIARADAAQSFTGLQTFNGGVKGLQFQTNTNCSSSSGTCSSAPAGSVSIAAAATTVTVATTAVTANSQIFIQEDSSLGTKLSVTCNTTTGRLYTVTTRTAATSFVITASAAPTTNPACLSYFIIN